jgi:hypothetical protein
MPQQVMEQNNTAAFDFTCAREDAAGYTFG